MFVHLFLGYPEGLWSNDQSDSRRVSWKSLQHDARRRASSFGLTHYSRWQCVSILCGHQSLYSLVISLGKCILHFFGFLFFCVPETMTNVLISNFCCIEHNWWLMDMQNWRIRKVVIFCNNVLYINNNKKPNYEK